MRPWEDLFDFFDKLSFAIELATGLNLWADLTFSFASMLYFTMCETGYDRRLSGGSGPL